MVQYEIYEHLVANKNKMFTITDLAEVVNKNRNPVSRALLRIESMKGIEVFWKKRNKSSKSTKHIMYKEETQ